MIAALPRYELTAVGILMSVEFYRESPGKFGSRTLSRKTLSRWTGRKNNIDYGRKTITIKHHSLKRHILELPTYGLLFVRS